MNHPLALCRSPDDGAPSSPLLSAVTGIVPECEGGGVCFAALVSIEKCVLCGYFAVSLCEEGKKTKKSPKMNSPKMNSPKMMMSPRLSNLRKYQFSDKLQTFNEKVGGGIY